jgi:hypothetical protein
MRLQSLAFAGYRSFAARSPAAPDRPLERLQLAPLTILLGKNNSGKSTVARLFHHVLLALGADGNDPFPMKSSRRSYGTSFRDIQHEGNFFNPLDLEIELASNDGARTTLISQLTQVGELEGDRPPVLQVSTLNGQQNPNLGKVRGLLPDVKEAESLRLEARELLDMSCHLQPVRDPIQPSYGIQPNSQMVLPETNASVAQMLYANAELRAAVGTWTANNLDGWRLDLKQNLDVCQLVARRGAREGNLADSGQGIQQVLPVVEQPELHLHDAAHAPLGDLLLSAVTHGQGNILVETHSESLVLRVRRRVAEGLNPNKVAIVYVQDTGDGSRVRQIHLNSDGEVDWWPEGVFSESFLAGLIEDAPEITPQVLHLRDLLKWVRQGRVRVPNFQRDFTWDRGRMLDLFDSIRRQYPIGTLLFWESTKARPMSPNLGPLSLPNFQGGKLLIMDGQQRLTTLAGVLLFDELGRSSAEDRDPKRWQVWYDAASDNFSHFDNDDSPPSAVKVSELMGTKGLYSAAQRIMAATDIAADPILRDTWIGRIETVSAALGAYRLPLVIFATESLRLVVESFTRLNRAGQSMGADEMFSALTYEATDETESFRLSKHIDSILTDIVRTGFGEVERVTVLYLVLLAVGLDPFRTEWDQLAKDTQKHSAAKLPEAIAEARHGLLTAIEFLRTEGIRNRRLLPYSMQLVGLAAFFGKRKKPPTEGQQRLLRRWLWVSAFTEGFGGLNPSRIRLQLSDLYNEIPDQDEPTVVNGIDLSAPAHAFPERHDMRSARVRALLCVMLRAATLRPTGETITPEQMAEEVLERGPDSLVKVCSQVKNVGKLASSPANRVFDVARGQQAKKWLVALPPLTRTDILDSHHISDRAWCALVEGDHRTFVEERTKTLMALERTFMAEKGVTPPKSDQPAPSAIDVEDQVPLSESADSD